nr:redoxin domain-containing protein [Neobacillus sp. Marseille-Q6967]
MVKKIITAVVLIAFLTVAVVQAMDKKAEPENASQEAANMEGLKVGAKAPDFELKTLAGDTVKLSDLKGKKVMLNFWATWCPPCKAEMPAMEQLHKELGDEVVILAVNIDPHLDVKAFVDENGITFPIPLDEKDEVNELYQILSIPTTYFIDSNGNIGNKYIGAMNLEAMKQYTSDLK